MRLFSALFALATASLAVATVGFSDEDIGTSLTVYSNADPSSFDPTQFIAQQSQGFQNQHPSQVPGFGIVKEVREFTLNAGVNVVRVSNVAQFIDPTTVTFLDLTDSKTVVREQIFQFDLANSEKILRRYLDNEITVVITKGNSTEEITGTLLSTAGQLVLKTASGIQLLERSGTQIKLGELPGGLISKPTLVWKLDAKTAGKRKIRSTYQTAGMTWRTDYNVILNSKDTVAEIGAWVTLMNLSGSTYDSARLKLIAGDVQRIEPNRGQQKFFGRVAAMELSSDAIGFTGKPFFEYHLYTLPEKIDVLSNATQQITLFPTAKDVKVEKVLVYNGADTSNFWQNSGSALTDRELGNQSNPKVDVYVKFKNTDSNNMGMALPKGKVRVFKQDDVDKSLEFIGEDLIDHTPRDETVLVRLGNAFDVVGEHTQSDYAIDVNKRQIVESFKVTVRNQKSESQKVIMKENLFRWSNWEITAKSNEFEKIDARTIHFNVEVPARGEKTVSYTVKYTW